MVGVLVELELPLSGKKKVGGFGAVELEKMEG
jgi:hypothetical protein